MIAKRYGTRIHQVHPRFNAHALTEIAFDRGTEAWDAEEWLAAHERTEELRLTAQSEGSVKADSEKQVLDELERRLREAERNAGSEAVLLIENGGGPDQPKTHDTTREIDEPLATRLHFHWHVDPPLRIGIYRPLPA